MKRLTVLTLIAASLVLFGCSPYSPQCEASGEYYTNHVWSKWTTYKINGEDQQVRFCERCNWME